MSGTRGDGNAPLRSLSAALLLSVGLALAPVVARADSLALWRIVHDACEPHAEAVLELFVFGGAVLLHDFGHAFAAYKEGLSELKQTPEYRDAVAARLRKDDSNPPREDEIANPPEEVAVTALFTTLRRLHAKQAEVLATRPFGEL